MRRSNVIQNPRIASEPKTILPEEIRWSDSMASGAKIEDVRLHTEREVEAARRQGLDEGLARGRQEGFSRGHEEGLSEGRREERERLRGEGEALRMIGEEIVGERSRILVSAGRDLVRLALSMAERICRRSLSLDREAVLRAIREALGLVGEAQRVVVRINPGDIERIRAQARELQGLLSENSRLELRPDPTVSSGGCAVDTPELHLDATVEGFLERFEDALSTWSEGQVLDGASEPGGSAESGEMQSDAA